jgi:predicted transcriptional regulator
MMEPQLEKSETRPTKKKAVIVIRDPETIHMMSDSMRKEIHRILSMKPTTETELSELLGITKASVGYHLKLLKEAGIIKVERTAIEEHGILQKFYETTSVHFVIDYEKAPLMIRKHYLDVHMERLRGILGLFQMVQKTFKRYVPIKSDMVEELAEEIAKSIAVVGAEHENEETELDRETYLTVLYGEALAKVAENDRWRRFFKETGVLGEFIISSLRLG